RSAERNRPERRERGVCSILSTPLPGAPELRMAESPGGADDGATPPLETTTDLLSRVRAGDERARETLIARILPPLRRWAHQRLPRGARDLHDTDDLVQMTVLRALRRLDDFESRGPGALLGYVRQVLLNAIRDELRRIARRPLRTGVDATLAA